MSADANVEENDGTLPYRHAAVNDVVQMLIDTSCPYFRHVVNNQGIFVEKPLRVIKLVDVDKKMELTGGKAYWMYPLSINGSSKLAFCLYDEYNRTVHLAKVYDLFLVLETLKESEK